MKWSFGKYSSYSPNIFRRIYQLFLENFIALLKIVEYVSASKEKLTSLGFDFQDEAMLTTMSLELVRSSEIEGESLNMTEVRSSIARRLGIETAGLVPDWKKRSLCY